MVLNILALLSWRFRPSRGCSCFLAGGHSVSFTPGSNTVIQFQVHLARFCPGHEVLALVRPVVPYTLSALSSKHSWPVVSPAVRSTTALFTDGHSQPQGGCSSVESSALLHKLEVVPRIPKVHKTRLSPIDALYSSRSHQLIIHQCNRVGSLLSGSPLVQWKVSERDGSHTGEVVLGWVLIEQTRHEYMSGEYKKRYIIVVLLKPTSWVNQANTTLSHWFPPN